MMTVDYSGTVTSVCLDLYSYHRSPFKYVAAHTFYSSFIEDQQDRFGN